MILVAFRPACCTGRAVRPLLNAFGWVIVVCFLGTPPIPAQHPDEPRPVDFAHDVMPLIQRHCANCHTNGRYEAGLSLDTRQSILDAGVVSLQRPAESELMLRVASDDAAIRMPPVGTALDEREIDVLRRWIAEGLHWETDFTFLRSTYIPRMELRDVALPPSEIGQSSHPVDRLIAGAIQLAGEAAPATDRPLAGDWLFARRAFLDLIGLLPTPDEVEVFASDSRDDKYRRLVERLLARDRDYAEHWLTFWNDLLRNDYSGTGYIDGGRKQITWWLYQSLLDNKPYDRMIHELVNPPPAAEGFLKGITWRGNVNASQTVELQFAQNVSQVFLGVNLKCASCHDSFVDHWKLSDAYSMAAVVAEQPLQLYRCDVPTGATAAAGFLYPELGEIDPHAPRGERLDQLARLLTAPGNGRTPRTIVNRLWQRLMGRGLVEPVDVMDNEPANEDLLDWLAADFVAHGWDLKHTLARIATSRAYRSETVPAPRDGGPSPLVGPIPKRMTAEQFTDAVWQITGTWPDRPAVDFPDRGGAPVRASLVAADRLMIVLGRPNREQVVTTRPHDLTTLEALDLTNGHILAERLSRGARRLAAKFSDVPAESLIDHLFISALARRPTDAEYAVARPLVQHQRSDDGATPLDESGLADLLWIIVTLPEFQLVR